MEHKVSCCRLGHGRRSRRTQGDINKTNNCRRGYNASRTSTTQVRRAQRPAQPQKRDNTALRNLVEDGFVSRDLTQHFVQTGDEHYARQSCFTLVDQADASEVPHALVFQAETELGLGNIPAALTCLHRALALDKQLFGARILLAMIAQQSGDLEAAQNQLEHAQALQTSNKNIKQFEMQVVLRQLAEVHETKASMKPQNMLAPLIDEKGGENHSERVCGFARFLSRKTP